ncbi:MAG: site-specific integrase, partial [Hydrogenoanaerobacterium sp.]
MTFNQISEQWLNIHEIRIGHSTYIGYKNDLKHLSALIENTDITKIKYSDLQGAINKLCVNEKAGKLYSKRTVNGFKNTLSQVFTFAMKSGYISENISKSIDISNQLKRAKSRGCLTENELQSVLNFPHKYRDFVVFIYYTGIRRGEALALLWKDIDWKNKCVRINKSVEFINNHPHVKCPKTENSERIIPLPDTFIPYLHMMRNRSTNDYIFTQTTTGKPHTESSYKKMWNRWFNDLNIFLGGTKEHLAIRRLTAHMLRHTYITYLFEHKIPSLVIQNVAGHSDITFTLRQYTHIREELEKLSFAHIRSIF